MKLQLTLTLAFLALAGASENGIRRKRNLKSGRSLKSGKSSKSGKSAQRAVTMWWVLFNKPSECLASPAEDVKCAMSDVMGAANGENKADIVIMHAAGGISDMEGCLRLTSTIYKTGTGDLDLGDPSGVEHYIWGGPAPLYNPTSGSKGYCPAEGEDTEVHLVFRDHGPVTDNKLWQLTRFTDPSCAQNGGPNVCADSGSAAFASMAEDGMMSKDVGGFPMFPPGCAAAGNCDAAVEMIQFSAGMGNEVTLVKTGDALQVVAEVFLPMV